MKILIVEDQPEKKASIRDFLFSKFEGISVSDCSSLRGALKEITTSHTYDLILLDMSMPAFEPFDSYFDDSTESYAGSELIEQMKLREIFVPVIIVTQYSSFEGGHVTLEGLSQSFYEQYENFYKGHVYYNSANEKWKRELEEKILSMRKE